MLLAAGLADGEADPSEFLRVSEALANTRGIEADLRALCDGIGSRMAGTPGMRRALDWAVGEFVEAGLPNARLEAVPMPLSWSEGPTRIEALEPAAFPVRAAASALSPPFRQTEDGELVYGGTGQPGYIARSRERFRGRILLVRLDQAGSFNELAVEQRDAMIAVREAEDAGARAVLLISTRPNRLLYRHVNTVTGTLDGIPSAVVAREDGLRMLRLLQDGSRVRVRIEMPNRIGPAYETANVVADLPGVDLPDEVVLMGAHLDSWDMGTGCLDNAANAALVMNVAREIVASGLRPRRTLRFVLFGGEELGLFGSRAYVARHRADLDGHVAVIVHDMGSGPLLGYSVGGRKELIAKLRPLIDAASLPGKLRLSDDPFLLSDNFTFMLQGVPSLFALQDTSEFFLTYHSEADSFDKVGIADLTDTARIAAEMLLGISESESRFADRWSETHVADWMRGAGLVRHLRFLGVWDAWRPAPRPE